MRPLGRLAKKSSKLYTRSMAGVNTDLRALRTRAGLTQEELARQASISRQAYVAIEAARAVPSTKVALRLARALRVTVEELFSLAEEPAQTVEAQLVDSPLPSTRGTRVQLAQVGDRLLARPLVGAGAARHTLVGAGGVLVGQRRGRARIRLLDKGALTAPALVMVGCDPSVALLARALQERGVRLLWTEEASRDALDALARGETHVAGCHLLDEQSGRFNVPFVRRLVPFPCTVVGFAQWRQGLVIATGNPKGIRGVDDLARPDVRLINRQHGSGSRHLLDRLLSRHGLLADQVAGYDRHVNGHLAVAELVSAGLADAGMAVEAAARAYGLDFLPLGEERYDLVVPNRFLELAPVRTLLDLLRRPQTRREVEALGGYDAASMGLPVGA